MSRVRDAVTRVAATDFSVLAIGESGSGKELVARSVHDQSERRGRPFFAVSCSALSSGPIDGQLFERAEGGTLFLDEIADLPTELQNRLLRVLESGTFNRVGGVAETHADARIIAATTCNPPEAVRDGRLRQDLLYHIAVFPIFVPPLRARDEDAIDIADAFLAELNLRHGTDRQFSPRSREFLRNHRWPGNIRELRNVVERGFALADTEISLAPTLTEFEQGDSQGGPPGAITLRVGNTLDEAERAVIEATLRHLGGSKTRTAAALGCSLKTLYNKLNGYSLLPRTAGN